MVANHFSFPECKLRYARGENVFLSSVVCIHGSLVYEQIEFRPFL